MDSDRLVFVLNRKTLLQFHRGRDGERRVRGGRGARWEGLVRGKGGGEGCIRGVPCKLKELLNFF